jgi:hypothetical protein
MKKDSKSNAVEGQNRRERHNGSKGEQLQPRLDAFKRFRLFIVAKASRRPELNLCLKCASG